jgi:hypothetical protein
MHWKDREYERKQSERNSAQTPRSEILEFHDWLSTKRVKRSLSVDLPIDWGALSEVRSLSFSARPQYFRRTIDVK